MAPLEFPAEFDHSYPGMVVELRLSSEEIIKVCGKGPRVLACSWPPVVKNGACVQFLPRVGMGGVGQRMADYLKRWENARCNGWKDNTAKVY